MGLHTGEPALGEEGYLGIDVVRAARLCTAGRGGHVLLSETTRALLGSPLPDGVTVAPLGERQLKDLDEPERFYELEVEGVEQTTEATAPAAPAAATRGSVDWKERGQELARQLTDRINEDVMRSLERSLGGAAKPSEPPDR